MAKIIFQDIKKNKSIRDIKKGTTSSSARPKIQPKPKMHFIDEDISPIHRFDLPENRKNKGSKYTLWVIALICIGALLFALSYLFLKASVSINPKSIDIVVNQSLLASKDDKSSDLYYSIVSIEGEEKKNFDSGNAKEVKLSAKGVAIIFNTFSKIPQNLDINTRLEGSNGKIYKTEKKVAVPGVNADGSPGKIEVGIYANENGEDYNSGPIDFKILGFKGSSKYTKIYGRSKGAISGGLIGNVKTLTEIEKQSAYSELKKNLKDKLLSKVVDQIPEGFLLYSNAVFFETNEEKIDNGAVEDKVEVSVSGKLYGFLLNEKVLTNKIARNLIEKYNNEDIYIKDIKNLDFTVINSESVTSDIDKLSIKLSGNSKFIYRVDTNKIAGDLVGKNKKYFNQILSDYLNIDSANLEIFPPWISVLPDDVSKIKVNVNYPK